MRMRLDSDKLGKEANSKGELARFKSGVQQTATTFRSFLTVCLYSLNHYLYLTYLTIHLGRLLSINSALQASSSSNSQSQNSTSTSNPFEFNQQQSNNQDPIPEISPGWMGLRQGNGEDGMQSEWN